MYLVNLCNAGETTRACPFGDGTGGASRINTSRARLVSQCPVDGAPCTHDAGIRCRYCRAGWVSAAPVDMYCCLSHNLTSTRIGNHGRALDQGQRQDSVTGSCHKGGAKYRESGIVCRMEAMVRVMHTFSAKETLSLILYGPSRCLAVETLGSGVVSKKRSRGKQTALKHLPRLLD